MGNIHPEPELRRGSFADLFPFERGPVCTVEPPYAGILAGATAADFDLVVHRVCCRSRIDEPHANPCVIPDEFDTVDAPVAPDEGS